MEEERIEAVKAWPEPISIGNIQVFLGFTNFYRRFIQGFWQNRSAAYLDAENHGRNTPQSSGQF